MFCKDVQGVFGVSWQLQKRMNKEVMETGSSGLVHLWIPSLALLIRLSKP